MQKHRMEVNEVGRHQSVRVLAGLGLALVLSDSSFCQGPVPAQRNISRPTVSPYLNLANGGSRGLNYFTQVRPQQQFRSFGAGVERQLQTLRSDFETPTGIDELGRQAFTSTGHATSFQNTGGYFSGGAGALGSVGGSASRARPSAGGGGQRSGGR